MAVFKESTGYAMIVVNIFLNKKRPISTGLYMTHAILFKALS